MTQMNEKIVLGQVIVNDLEGLNSILIAQVDEITDTSNRQNPDNRKKPRHRDSLSLIPFGVLFALFVLGARLLHIFDVGCDEHIA